MTCAALALAGAAAAAPPKPGTAAARGYHLYGEYCVSCHGALGPGGTHTTRTIGAGPRREQVQQGAKAPSLVGVGAQSADFYLRTGYMPLPHMGIQPRRARVPFSDRQIRDLVAYVASLGGGPPIPTPHPERGSVSLGMHLFTDHCAGCHQVAAQGGYVTGATPPPLEGDSATQIAEAVRIGPNVMPTFSTKAISNAQLDSIIAYVDYAKHPQDAGGFGIGHIGPVPEGLVTWFIAAAVLIAVCMLIGERLRRES